MPVRETKTPPRNRRGAGGAAVRRLGSLNGATVPRARIMKAMLEIVHEHGYAAVSATALLSKARVSSKTFYEHFGGVEDCFVATFDECVRELQAVVAPAYRREGQWSERVRAALEAALFFFEHDRAIATLLVVEAPKVCSAVDERREHILQVVRIIIDVGRSQANGAPRPPEITNEVVVEGAIAVVRARLQQPEQAELVGLVNPLMAMITYSYLGAAAAAHELEQPVLRIVTPSSPRATTRNAILTSVGMRMTLRTARVLGAIAEKPGASNREVADAAGITDQAQISRLLSRLAGLDLVENEAEEESWAPNGWRLTPRGERVERAVRHEFA